MVRSDKPGMLTPAFCKHNDTTLFQNDRNVPVRGVAEHCLIFLG